MYISITCLDFLRMLAYKINTFFKLDHFQFFRRIQFILVDFHLFSLIIIYSRRTHNELLYSFSSYGKHHYSCRLIGCSNSSDDEILTYLKLKRTIIPLYDWYHYAVYHWAGFCKNYLRDSHVYNKIFKRFICMLIFSYLYIFICASSQKQFLQEF